MNFDTICVVGLGYIGLPTAAMFASRRKKVVGVDINQNAVDTINRGEIHIVEPELDIAVHAAVKEGYLRATVRPEPADAFLVAVPTPFKKGLAEGDIPSPDLVYIKDAAKSIAPVLKRGNLVILESTSPVGATEKMAEWLAEERPDLTFPQVQGEESDIRIAHCPERVLPGRIMHELIENDRIIGGITEKCAQEACDLYKCFVIGECLKTTARTAEMAKLTENAFRDVNIAFANEISIIAHKMDVNVWELIELANRHPRVNILRPGPGVGGHCIAVDPWFIVSQNINEANLIKTARQINDEKPNYVIEQIDSMVDELLKSNDIGSYENVTVACYGLAFKPDVDDLRESPALHIFKTISQNRGYKVIAVEPNIEVKKESQDQIDLVSIDYATKKADIHVLLVNHKEFKDLSFENHMSRVLDICGVWE